jgi:Sortase domain
VRTPLRLALAGLLATVLAGAWAFDSHRPPRPVSPAPVAAGAAADRAAAGPAASAPPVRPIIGAEPAPAGPRDRIAEPVRLRIPALHVDSPLERLGRRRDGTLTAPSRWDEAGWYTGGPRPGEQGPAVVAGHVDSTAGPAVFFDLRRLGPGAVVQVVLRGGRVERWVVDDVRAVPKDRFPTALVYGPQPVPVLRLITCTGDFDAAAHSYVDNLVVSAHLT